MTEKYFKITNAEENHNGFQYVDGLNVLDKPFEEIGTCVPGGLYFSNAKYILEFLSYGIYLREISLPTDDPDFKMIQDPVGRKWRANKIILGERRNLSEISTWEYLFSLGAINMKYNIFNWASQNGCLDIIKFFIVKDDNLKHFGVHTLCRASTYGQIAIVKYLTSIGINVKNNIAITEASKFGHLNIVKYLIKKGSDVHTAKNLSIQNASMNGHLDVVKFLIEKGADFRVDNEYPLRFAAYHGHLDMVNFLVEKGANIRGCDDFAIKWASEKGHLSVVKFLAEKGANFKRESNYAIRWASRGGHLEVVEFLVENGADFRDKNNQAIEWAAQNGHTKVVKFLVKAGADVNKALACAKKTKMIKFLTEYQKATEVVQ